ncbi:MAG TPA: alkaline phosphatase family protein, partial [Anaerolineae bacterium]|nr:alkaline phosphatase family protein [Anaerolineae bacterium]
RRGRKGDYGTPGRAGVSGMKVLVIGLDGVTFDLLGPWIESGDLPNLRKLVEQGASGKLRTTLPPISSSSWSSFLTGVNPGKHGLVDFVYPGADSYKVSMINATSRRTRSLWNWLNDAGFKVGLLGIPTTYPTEPVNGFMISGFLAPGPDSEWAYPPELKQELRAELGEFQLSPDERYRSTRWLDRFLEDLTASVENRTQAALYLMRNKPWDLFAVVYWDTDMVQHETWRLLDPNHPRHDSEEAAAQRDQILAFHRKVDADVGRLLAEVDSDTLVVVMSDHGFGPVHSFFLTNNWLASLGLLQFKSNPWTTLKRALFRLGFTPLQMFRIVKALGMGKLRRQVRFQQKAGLLNRVFLSFDDVDWSRTQAFSIGSFGQVYVNLAGVRPEGIVQPGQEYEELKERITREAMALRDPRSGEPLVERVYRREEIYSGPYIDRTPDLIVQPQGWQYMAFGHADFGSNKLVEPIIGLSGHHRPDGVLILSGEGVKPGTHVEGAHILDLAPTILHAMGIDVPQDLDGRVLDEAFEPSSPVSQPVSYSQANVYKDGASEPDLSDEEMEEVQEKLRGWGYAG